MRKDELETVTEPTEAMLARFFGIDLNKVDNERRAVLAYQRRRNEAAQQ